MKDSSKQKRPRRSPRARKSVSNPAELAGGSAAESVPPDPPVLPDVYTKDRSLLRPTRKQRPGGVAKKDDDDQVDR